jgi:hypothetical protein
MLQMVIYFSQDSRTIQTCCAGKDLKYLKICPIGTASPRKGEFMKETLTAPSTDHTVFPFNMETISFGCLLILASMLALVGGMATSVLFFGLLLTSSLLLLGTRLVGASATKRHSRYSPE